MANDSSQDIGIWYTVTVGYEEARVLAKEVTSTLCPFPRTSVTCVVQCFFLGGVAVVRGEEAAGECED
jgi:hypothetical protein